LRSTSQPRRKLEVAACIAFAMTASILVAQPPESPVPSSPPTAALPATDSDSSARPIRESGPPVMYLKNKKGETIVVPSVTIEELERLLQLDRGVGATVPPRFTFADTIQLTGTATGLVAELQATFEIRITPGQSPDEWLRVPLKLTQGILAGHFELEGEGELQADYQPAGDGHVVWMRTPAKTPIKIKARFKLPINTVNGEKHLTLTVPNRSTVLRLTVDSPDAEGRTDDEQSTLLSKSRSDDGRTIFTADGSGGTINLSWRDTREPAPVLQADGSILVELANRSFDVEAILRVRGYGQPIETFTVRLPPGVEWLGQGLPSSNGIQISVLNASPESRTRQRLLVRRLEGKTSNPIEVRLKAVSKSNNSAAMGPIDVSGFEVVGAQIQRGTIDCVVRGDWSVDWETDSYVRRVDVPEALRTQQVAARFEYDGQPFLLRARVGKADPRINVEPTYIVSVEPNQLNLDATLRYRVSGSRADKLVFDTGGWVIDRIAPAELLSGQWKTNRRQLEIPLSPPSSGIRGEFELQIAAHQALPSPGLTWSLPFAGTTVPGLLSVGPVIGEPWFQHLANELVARDIQFELPRPVATAATPGIVIISPADNIEVSPRTDQLRWLVADTLPAQVKLPIRQQPPLVYREDVTGQSPWFSGVSKLRRQAISVALENSVRVEERDVLVEQRMVFQISFEPASALAFDVPRSLRDSGELEVLVDGNSLPMNPLGQTASTESDRQTVTVELREKRIGPCEILFRYRTPRSAPSTGNSPTFSAALVRPVQSESTRIVSSALRLSSPAALRVSLVDDTLRPIEDATTGATLGNDLLFQLDQVPSHLLIAAVSTEAPGRRSTMVDRVWIQSLLTSNERRDRACMRLSTNESRLELLLPTGAGTNDITVVIDGRSTEVIANGNEVQIELDESLGRREMTLEIWYWFTAQSVPLGRLQLQAPQLLGGSHANRVYWELLLPANEHLIWASRNLVPENSWRWQGAFLTRVPNRTQLDLERWTQASHRQEIDGFNKYVFSSISAVGSHTIVTAIRPIAAFIVIVSVFCAGVLFLYVPILRHPVILIAVGGLLAGVAISFPEPCLVAGQGIAAGLVLVILVRLLMGVLWRNAAPRSAARTSSQGLSEPRLSDSVRRRTEKRVDMGSGVGTATIPAPFQMSATGNEP
jgi:hypothetical protein